MDVSDNATLREEQEREIAMQRMRHSAKPLPQGECNNCGASCIGAFCDADCRNDYERRQSADIRNGRKP